MRAILYICLGGMITGCTTDQKSVVQWNDMWVDIALRHRLEKYSCGHALDGYSKDSVPAFSQRKKVTPRPAEQVVVKAKTPAPDLDTTKQSAQRAEESIRELNGRIAVLEDALKTNTATTNENQDLVVKQINALKTEITELQRASSGPKK